MDDRRKRGRPSLSELLGSLDEHVKLLHDHLGGLPRAVEADQILRQIWIDDVHNSTAIEGNTMTRAQVENLVEYRRTSGNLIENLEIEGYARAADWVYQHARDYQGVSPAVLSEIHRLTVGLVWQIDPPTTRDEPGAWRKGGVRIRAVQVPFPAAIPGELEHWSKSTARLAENHPVVHAAIHHAWLERIHPFVDGNGRVGRLILNFMLLQHEYPPAVILATQRPRYLHALQTADDGNPGTLAEVIARAVHGTLNRFLIPNLAGEAKLVPLSALSANSPYSATYLRDLVLDGRLRAVRDGHLWLSSKAWLNEYIASRDPRGRGRSNRAKRKK
jgi:cell filamentation protein, protein adenylyltransferase